MIIDGKKIAETILENLKSQVENLKKSGVFPSLAVILVGGDPASKTYVKNKKTACEKIGISEKEFIFPENTAEKEITELIEKLNGDKTVSGILVQLPLPPHLDSKRIIEKIDPLKDVDAFTKINKGELMGGNAKLLPCTPAGILELFSHEKINLEGKSCAVIGRSDIVGKPIALLLLQNNATVTICHSKTKNLKEICKNADIIVSAVGKPKLISREMVKKGVVIIDVGINRDENGKLCGDVDYNEVESVCSYITPVPGGVGPMTVAMLIKNTVKAAEFQNKRL